MYSVVNRHTQQPAQGFFAVSKVVLVLLAIISSMSQLSGVAVAQAPISAGSATVIDVPASSADALRVDIQKGRFSEQSVDKLSMLAEGIDFKQGALHQLTADLQNAQFDSLKVDNLHLVTGAFAFDPVELLSHRRFLLSKSVIGAVQLKISEASLNHYFSDPKTLEKLEKAANRKMGNMGLLKLSSPSLSLLGKNRLKASLSLSLAGAVATPVDMQGQLTLKAGKLMLEAVQLTSNGIQLPFDLVGVFTSKFNEAIDFERLGKKSFVIQANKLATVGKTLDVGGTVLLTKLEFGANSIN